MLIVDFGTLVKPPSWEFLGFLGEQKRALDFGAIRKGSSEQCEPCVKFPGKTTVWAFD
jgi:hypothetical protein